MMHGGALPMTQEAPSAYGSLPLMSEAIEMQHIQYLGQGIFNQHGANTAAFATNHSFQAMPKLNGHMDASMGVDADNHLLLNGRQGRLDALKFIDEQAAVSSVTGPVARDHIQNAYHQQIMEQDFKLTSRQI